MPPPIRAGLISSFHRCSQQRRSLAGAQCRESPILPPMAYRLCASVHWGKAICSPPEKRFRSQPPLVRLPCRGGRGVEGSLTNLRHRQRSTLAESTGIDEASRVVHGQGFLISVAILPVQRRSGRVPAPQAAFAAAAERATLPAQTVGQQLFTCLPCHCQHAPGRQSPSRRFHRRA